MQNETASVFDDMVPPPTSKKFLDDLEEVVVRQEGE